MELRFALISARERQLPSGEPRNNTTTMTAALDHTLSHWHIVIAWLIFLASYLVFAIGRLPGTKIDRPAMAVIGAVLMFAFGVLGPKQAIASVDFATLVLLFSMMLIVASLHLAGFFEWITRLAIEHLSAGQLLPGVIFISGILSAFLVNDIVCLVMAPLILGLCKRMGLKPVPYLLALATASNIGSTATITGNPQNILIGSISGISYRDFLVHLGPVAILGLFVDWALLHWIHLRNGSGAGQCNQRKSRITNEPRVGNASRLAGCGERWRADRISSRIPAGVGGGNWRSASAGAASPFAKDHLWRCRLVAAHTVPRIVSDYWRRPSRPG